MKGDNYETMDSIYLFIGIPRRMQQRSVNRKKTIIIG